MQLSSDAQIPDGLLAANALLSEKPHQGVPSWNLAPHQGIDERNSTAAIGLRVGQHLNRVWPRYTGKERDNESGNDYFGARYYSSAMGRWTSPDPYNPIIIRQGMKAGGLPEEAADSFFTGFLENPQNWNMYNYVRNNPLRLVDPNGMAPSDGHHLISDREQFPEGTLAKDFTENIKTGGLSGNGKPNQPGFNGPHRDYNEGVEDALNQAEQTQGPAVTWSLQQWKDFAYSILKSNDLRIKQFLDDLEVNNPGAKAALNASIAAYQVTARVVARVVTAAIFNRIFFVLCFDCFLHQDGYSTHRFVPNPNGPA